MRQLLLPLLLVSTLPAQTVATLPVADIIAETARNLEEFYVFPEIGRQIAETMRAREKAGAYRDVSEAGELAKRLMADLQFVNHDKHLWVRPVKPGSARGNPLSAENAADDNAGFVRVEILPGNVGYLDIRLFYPLALSRDAVVAAMNRLAGTRALIFDLRKHGGGEPETIAFLSSYLFGPVRVHLNDLYFRRTGAITEFWTETEVPGARFGPEKPVYVLTSKYTFSGAEEFAYNLQNLQRATIIGETTGGGANPGDIHPLPGGLVMFVPGGRAINPVSKTNWEGVGVKPDAPLPAKEAFAEAYRRATAGIPADAATREAIDRVLAEPPEPR